MFINRMLKGPKFQLFETKSPFSNRFGKFPQLGILLNTDMTDF